MSIIYMIGTDHTLAPVDVRAVFSFTKEKMAKAMEQIRSEMKADGIVILSTCNRLEIWLSMPDGKEKEEHIGDTLFAILCGIKNVDPDQYDRYFVRRSGSEAVEHLFYLTCGLKSAIIAEDQIVTQVKDALAFSHEHSFSDGVMEVLFRMAVTAAKKIKTEVSFTRADHSLMNEAVRVLAAQGVPVKGKKCMVIGNGAMGRLAASRMVRMGADVSVTVREYHKGTVQIPQGCKRIPYRERMRLFPECDIVISATASPHLTITKQEADACKVGHDMILIDLAVPRDIDPDLAGSPHFRLYNIDDFHTDADSVNGASFRKASEILQKEMDEFYDWMNGRAIIPRIQSIQDEAATDLNLRLHKVIRKSIQDAGKEKKMEDRIHLSAEKVTGKLLFALRDGLPEEEFLHVMQVLEDVYEE